MHFLDVILLPPILELERQLFIKTLRSGHSLSLLGTPGNSMASVIQQATSFIFACYGQTHCSSMLETRLKVWLSKTGRRSSTPKLCTLPPTTEAFKENVKRAHHQALVWRSLEPENPPQLETAEFGWLQDDQNKSLQPVTLPDEVEIAPEMVLCHKVWVPQCYSMQYTCL